MSQIHVGSVIGSNSTEICLTGMFQMGRILVGCSETAPASTGMFHPGTFPMRRIFKACFAIAARSMAMLHVFNGRSSLNCDVSTWDVSNATNLRYSSPDAVPSTETLFFLGMWQTM